MSPVSAANGLAKYTIYVLHEVDGVSWSFPKKLFVLWFFIIDPDWRLPRCGGAAPLTGIQPLC